jgi:hypothetical protein
MLILLEGARAEYKMSTGHLDAVAMVG